MLGINEAGNMPDATTAMPNDPRQKSGPLLQHTLTMDIGNKRDVSIFNVSKVNLLVQPIVSNYTMKGGYKSHWLFKHYRLHFIRLYIPVKAAN